VTRSSLTLSDIAASKAKGCKFLRKYSTSSTIESGVLALYNV